MSASVEEARIATVSDLTRIVELAVALRAELHDLRGGALWEVREARVDPTPSSLQEFLARPHALIAVGTIDDVVVGYGTLEIETLTDGSKLGIVGDLFVEYGARDIGVGECIAEFLVARAREGECAGIDAFALPGHREAKNFFERAGFTARALTMHKRLT